ncbi:PASTA domain-containing protein [Rathayibacter rathayi]|uniref:PASTA domain-containing protein n=1 Tax=Rathayibacter rathayi TaxID=33887 RepID=UPI003B968CF9
MRSVGFTVRTDATAVPSDRPAGTVARTNPPAGSRVSKGVEITLQISAGPAPRV